MDFQLQGLLRRYLLTKDPLDAERFVNQFVRAHGNPNAASDEFYDAWWWLQNHPAFYRQAFWARGQDEPGFFSGLDISVQKVNPLTGRIDDNKALNTQVEFWLENGPWMRTDDPANGIPEDMLGDGEIHSHDINLDCGGLTYEEALLNMAKLVREHYGDYPQT